jgi:hypothetical protein
MMFAGFLLNLIGLVLIVIFAYAIGFRAFGLD